MLVTVFSLIFLWSLQCVKVLGQYKGVCQDSLVGGADDNQLHTAVREDGISVITYRRKLISCKSRVVHLFLFFSLKIQIIAEMFIFQPILETRSTKQKVLVNYYGL